MTTRAEAIIERFTRDPGLMKQILQHIEDFRAGKTSLDQIIAQHTSDPDLTAKIKERVAAVRAGKHVVNVTTFGADNADHAASAAEKANIHRGAVANIVKHHHRK